ncbi:unnamed protein product [Linum tenue]|uniref:Secreted protein n=1 Tax=Linum tenue TaxID=586396 RepID=A0AAV0MRM6_9ROSI|nr:unnamed protein product [Linum tenue]
MLELGSLLICSMTSSAAGHTIFQTWLLRRSRLALSMKVTGANPALSSTGITATVIHDISIYNNVLIFKI